PALIDDFYTALQKDPLASRVVEAVTQVDRLKLSLRTWLDELFDANFDEAYVARRWQIGWRHVEVGLRQVYVNIAMSRLRLRLVEIIAAEAAAGRVADPLAVNVSLHRALDLDLALIQDAYESEKRVRSEAAFRNLVESAGCAIVILRGDHTVAYFNPYAERLTGYPAVEMLGREFFHIFFPAPERQQISDQFACILSGETATDHENSVVCRDGQVRRLVWNARRLEDFDGRPAVLAVGHDITELRDAQQRAVQTERLAAIGQTVTGLAHESRNAFQRIQACLEMLSLEVGDRPEALELVERIGRAQSHLHQLYEEVRGYAAPIQLQWQKCDLSRVLKETWGHLEIARRQCDVRLNENFAGVDLLCEGDPFAIGQVFRNIIENSLAVCQKDGLIDVSAQACEWNSAPAIAVTIRDNGPGMPAAVRKRIFEPFFTTKTKGTGLGMAIARRIVEAHGGQIDVGEPASGTEIAITLPRERQRRY
ncbi:MAG: PAS domain S-box protein, partial [Planctomycetales bacterium]|nr:PAS domain S-box protein [Planctomycetales bacterium]